MTPPERDELAEATFQVLLESLYTTRFTGYVALHFHNGIPRIAEWGRPHRVTITKESSENNLTTD